MCAWCSRGANTLSVSAVLSLTFGRIARIETWGYQTWEWDVVYAEDKRRYGVMDGGLKDYHA